jgi:hypothetical protein
MGKQLNVRLSEILGFRTLSIVLVIKNTVKNKKETVKNTTFRKLDLIPSSGEGKPTLLGPLERASLSHWISESDTPSSESYSNYVRLLELYTKDFGCETVGFSVLSSAV